MTWKQHKEQLMKELEYITSLSSGAGGQHVNKVNTKVELRFHIHVSQYFTDEEKDQLKKKLSNRINKEGILILSSQESRSQFKNKQRVTEHFFEIIEEALKPEKKRKPTRPSKASKEQRLEEKKKISEKKARRKNIDLP